MDTDEHGSGNGNFTGESRGSRAAFAWLRLAKAGNGFTRIQRMNADFLQKGTKITKLGDLVPSFPFVKSRIRVHPWLKKLFLRFLL
jgi:hypothetical protein